MSKIRLFRLLATVLCTLPVSVLAFSTPTIRRRIVPIEVLQSSTSENNSNYKSSSERRRINASGKNRSFRKYSNNDRRRKAGSRRGRKTPAEIQYLQRRAEEVESGLSDALDSLREIVKSEKFQSKRGEKISISFPTVRDCNGALATFGDAGDFKRALRLFGLMRKSAALVHSYNSISTAVSVSKSDGASSTRLYLYPPSPTLVTYSTLMSRAASSGKNRVALRLWRMMISSTSYFANYPESTSEKNKSHDAFGAPIVPDIRAVNILMNVFAKMGDQVSAKMLMDQLYDGKVVPFDESIRMEGMAGTDVSTNSEVGGLGLIKVVPKMKPNIVTYNTLIDACHRTGDLDAGLEALNHMKQNTNLRPDAMTYTSLISSVARRVTKTSGKRDPDLAFDLYDEMVNVAKVRPNGMTYSALIDVCGRCRRSDLALKGLRMMLREKARRKSEEKNGKQLKNRSFILANEVGAWTAAIDACGKAGRVDTAIRLFKTMPQFDIKPNVYTCGALTDCLLKSNAENYLDETLEVLRYMKEEGIEPSEVMYTSLITSASKFAEKENKARGEIVLTDFGDRSRSPASKSLDDAGERPVALDVYTELIGSLTNRNTSANTVQKANGKAHPDANASDETLIKVFLVLQEMKASGADPDIACYNAILKACARAGDVQRLIDVFRKIQLDGLAPNKTTWKELLRGASIGRHSTMAEKMWTMAKAQKEEDNLEESYSSIEWIPTADEFDFLISSYIREAAKNPDRMAHLYSKVIDAYIGVKNGEGKFGFNHIQVSEVMGKPRLVNMISQAATFFRSAHNFPDLSDPKILSLKAKLRQIEQDLEAALQK